MAATHFSGPVVSTSGFTGDVTGDITGDVTGDLTGNVTGDVTGDITGDVNGYVTAQVEARTATADGTTTGTISAGTDFVTVTCDDANKIITLPAPVVGKVIWLRNAGTGYELRSSDPATIAINGGSGSGVESAVGANVLVRVVCDTATTWVATTFAAAGTVAALEAAA